MANALRARLRLALIGTATLLAFGVSSAHAATIPVGTHDDTLAADGVCSLREAVQSANTNDGGDSGCPSGSSSSTDTILIGGSDDTYPLMIGPSGDPDDNLTGDLDIQTNGGPVVIQGAGDTESIIEGDYFGSGSNDRVLDVFGSGPLTINSMRIYSGGTVGFPGGCIRENPGATVSLDATIVYSCSSRALAVGASSVGGGAVYVDSATFNMRNGSGLNGNSVGHVNNGEDSGSTIAGGGLLGENGAAVHIDESTINNNTVSTADPSIAVAGGGIAVLGAGGDLKITNSTVNANTLYKSNSASQAGGAVYWNNSTGTMRLQNSTFTMNGDGSPTGSTDPIPAEIDAEGGTVKAANLTISGNYFPSNNQTLQGPAIDWTAGGGNFEIRGSILASGNGADVYDNECTGDPITSLGYNVEAGPNDDCHFASAGDDIGDPGLGILYNQGGKTATRLATADISHGIIPAAECKDTEGAALTRDQRGVTRPAGSPCDGGAVQMACGGVSVTMVGTPGDDNLIGTPGDDSILAGDGDDIVDGGGGNDHICGGYGADTLNGGDDDDVLLPGDNPNLGTQSADTLDGGTGNNTISYEDYLGVGLQINLQAGSTTGAGGDSFTNIQNVIGGGTGDTITGDSNPNNLNGGPGSYDDQFVGGGGDDTLDGGGGHSFGDRVSYGTSTVPVTFDLANDTVTGDGTDTVTNIRMFTGSPQNDTWIPDENSNYMACNGGSDTVDYSGIPEGAGGVTIFLAPVYQHFYGAKGPATGEDEFSGICFNNAIGTPNDDFIAGNSNDNNIVGDDGNDTLSYLAATNTVNASLAAGTSTGAGNDTFSSFENLQGGSTSDDTLTGDDGDNILDGLDGDDHIDGAAGEDTYKFAEPDEPVIASLQTGTATGQGDDTFTNVENLIGSNENDSLEGNAGDNDLDGAAGNDTLSYAHSPTAVSIDLAAGTATGAGNDALESFENLTGSPQADTILGDDADNSLSGGPGDDVIDGRLGDDRMNGDAGSNTLAFNSVAQGVEIDLSAGDANGQGVDGFTGIQNFTGSSADDTIIGSGADNAVDGGGGAHDSLSFANSPNPVSVNLATHVATGFGADTVTGVEDILASAQDDTLHGDGADNDLNGGLGTDTLSFAGGPAVSASIAGATAIGDGTDVLSSIENLTGSDGADTLTGDGSGNVLDGGAGADTLDPKSGGDTVLAGPGADILKLRDGDVDSADCGAGADVDDVTADARGTDELTNCQNDRLSFLGEPTEGPVGGGAPPAPPGGGTPTPTPPATGGNGKGKSKCKKAKSKKAKKKCKKKAAKKKKK